MKWRFCHWMVLTVVTISLFFCPVAQAQEKYRVKRGDTLARISKTFHVSIHDLRTINHLRRNALKPNDTLIIPGRAKISRNAVVRAKGVGTPTSSSTQTWTVQKGDTLSSLAKKTGVSVFELKRLNHLRANRLRLGQKLILPGLEATPEIPDEDETVADSAGPVQDELDSDLTDDEVGEGNTGEAEEGQSADADPLGNWSNLMERQLLVKVAKGFIGAPYRLGGSSVRGIDCSGFVRKIYEIFNIVLPRTAHDQSHVGMSVSRGELEEGDLVFFHTYRSIGHVGIYIGNNQFVHAASGRQRMVRISNLDEPYYDRRYVKAVRLKGLGEEF